MGKTKTKLCECCDTKVPVEDITNDSGTFICYDCLQDFHWVDDNINEDYEFDDDVDDDDDDDDDDESDMGEPFWECDLED